MKNSRLAFFEGGPVADPVERTLPETFLLIRFGHNTDTKHGERGDFDFTPVFDILADADYEGWVVVEAEQDPAKANPFEYAVLARSYIREKTGL